MKRITILDLRDSPWVDGPGRTILECAEDLDAKRFRIIIGAFDSGHRGGTPYEIVARRKGLNVERIIENRTVDPKVLVQVIDLIRRFQVDIVHTHDFRSNSIGFLSAMLTHRPILATVHGWIANDKKTRLKTIIDKLLLQFFSHIIAVSKNTGNHLRLFGLSKSFTVIPNALRIDHYRPSRPYGVFRNELGIGKDEVLIANIGRLSLEKGQRILLESAKLLTDHTKFRIALIGIGPDLSWLEKFVKINGMNDKVLFVGYREDMNLVYNDLDLVVQSSFTEGMPNVILESLLMEVPVIATDVGGTREAVLDGITAVLIQPGDPFALSKKIYDHFRDPNIYKSMAQRGRLDVTRRFNHSDRVKRLEEVYEHVFAKHQRSID